MRTLIRCLLLALETMAWLSDGAQEARAQEWLLNSSASHFYMQTVKANSIFEVHQFTGLDGSITKDGDAIVKN